MNIMFFEERNAQTILKNGLHSLMIADLVALMREDGSFEVMKDRTGTIRAGEVVPYSKLMIIMSNIMFNYLYRKACRE